jgi:CDP-diacylglycerol---serine O-phosphatidyltransferase
MKAVKNFEIYKFIPNVITLGSLCMGLSSILYVNNGKWKKAAGMIIISAFMDGLDGRLARMLGSTSRFGAELDSLADFVAFGVAPSLIIYFKSLHFWGKLGWIPVLFYCMCAALRLARFNTMSIESNSSSKNHFVGVPITSAAILILTPMMITFNFNYEVPIIVNFICMIIVGLLMVSKIKTFSFKSLKIPENNTLSILLISVVFIIGAISAPWVTFPIISFVYLSSFLLSNKKT